MGNLTNSDLATRFPAARRIRRIGAGLLAAGLLATCLSGAAVADEQEDLAQMQSFLRLMDSYFDIIASVHTVSADAEKSAIYQMHKIQEIYEERGEKAKMVGILRSVLQRTSNPSIRNAAYMMLGDALQETGRADEAIESLQAGLDENLKQAQ